MAPRSVRTEDWADLDYSTRRGCALLWQEVWPTDGGIDARLDQMDARHESQTAHRVHMLLVDGMVVAVARTFLHTVQLGQTPRLVLALASVCSSPHHRGQGFGDAVARVALKRCEELGLPALFQTGVPAFYERMGSRIIENEIITSAPNAEPFHEPWAMIHPGDAEWDDTQKIDLLAPGW